MRVEYKLEAKDKSYFVSILLLDNIINKKHRYQSLLVGDRVYLDEYLIGMMADGMVTLSDSHYTVTEKGRRTLNEFMARYTEYIKTCDVFSAVDLEQGVFALSSFHDIKDDAQWERYLQLDRWEDVRVAVAQYQNQNPMEIVFMSFINEGRFNTEVSGWEYDMTYDLIWDEVVAICNTAIQLSDLDEAGSTDVISDIVRSGKEVYFQLA
jgi:hypothetical protein